MKRIEITQYNGHRLSIRLSITLWVAFALCLWLTLGVVVRYASHWSGDSMEAAGRRLSTIVPAAGPGNAGPLEKVKAMSTRSD